MPGLRTISRWIGRLAIGAALLFGGCYAVTSATRGPPRVQAEIQGTATPHRGSQLTLMTVNLAHGRSDGFHQLFLSKRAVRQNLGAVAAVIEREAPDVVAVQEADGPSAWSGRFDHVAFVAEAAGLPVHVRGEHVRGLKLRYGTGLLARSLLDDAASITFAPTPPTFSKGFVVASLPQSAFREGLDLVSVHLDFARSSVRGRQLDRLAQVLETRGRPAIVMGDFNTRWTADGHLAEFAERLGLFAFAPAEKRVTFPTTGRRIDWVLVPKGVEIIEHRVLPDVISDHRAVVVRLRLPTSAGP